jgi:hypothetical protein
MFWLKASHLYYLVSLAVACKLPIPDDTELDVASTCDASLPVTTSFCFFSSARDWPDIGAVGAVFRCLKYLAQICSVSSQTKPVIEDLPPAQDHKDGKASDGTSDCGTDAEIYTHF